MICTISITDVAARETEEAALYYEDVSAGFGLSFLAELDNIYSALTKYPEANSFIDDRNIIRDISLKRFPFVVIYTIELNNIVIASVHNTDR